MKKGKNVGFNILVVGEWICPYCHEVIKIEYNTSPYREIAEDPPDHKCPICREYFTLDFYDNEE